MKKILLSIVIIVSFASCSKENIAAPIPEKLGVTSYALDYDDKWTLINKKLSFHWHDLDPEIMQQFVDKPNDTLCTLAGNLVVTYKIEVDNCVIN